MIGDSPDHNDPGDCDAVMDMPYAPYSGGPLIVDEEILRLIRDSMSAMEGESIPDSEIIAHHRLDDSGNCTRCQKTAKAIVEGQDIECLLFADYLMINKDVAGG